jgi:glycosyltransferase involved in cell wall biosynthesis
MAKAFYGTPTPPEIERVLSRCRNHAQTWELLLYTLVVAGTDLAPGKPTVYFTMWESTRLPQPAIEKLNRCAVVIVPCSWCASMFSAAGVETPIRIVPLGVPMDCYEPGYPPSLRPFPERSTHDNRPFTFGTAARFEGGGIRKGFGLVVKAFQQAFGEARDVRLRVKAFSDCPVRLVEDTRIEVVKAHWTRAALAAWYQSLDVFVSGSGSEGWGLHQQEAMACGRPVVGVHFSGVTEFFNPVNGYAVDYQLAPGQGVYNGLGVYALPEIESMAAQMRLAYENRELLGMKSVLARQSARAFTMENSARRLLAVLREFKFL